MAKKRKVKTQNLVESSYFGTRTPQQIGDSYSKLLHLPKYKSKKRRK